MNKLDEAKQVFKTEIEALTKTMNSLDQTYLKILDLIVNCKGKVIFTGMGKPGHIASKLAATFSSLGTPSFKLHPAEAMHGDLGMISSNDIVIAISYSGESDEIIRILPNIKMIGAKLIGITGNSHSSLASFCDVVQVLPKFNEACYLGLAPTSSTTAVLCYGDSLAVVASGVYGFKDVDFGKFHPAGSLGKKLILRVKDLMSAGDSNSKVHLHDSLMNAIVELSQKGLGVVSIVDNQISNNLVGVITDGDLRRQLQRHVDIYSLKVDDIMNKNPITISQNSLAVDALREMKNNNVSCLVVVDENKPIGIIRLQDIIGVGIVE